MNIMETSNLGFALVLGQAVTKHSGKPLNPFIPVNSSRPAS